MSERPLRILQVATVDRGGGAASVADHLRRGYQARGHSSWLAVGRKTTDDPDVLVIPDDDRSFYRATGYVALQSGLRRRAGRFPGSGWGQLSRSLRFVTHPRALLNEYCGREDFEFPGTDGLLDLTSERPDVVHCHNLHGGYFDLRALAWLSQRVPTVVTLHDAWLLSGHCAHSFDCDRWKTGCGQCPDLSIEPAIRRDATAENWARKREVFAKSRLYVASPSRWLIDKVEQSMLAPAVKDMRLIPNGVDISVFKPAEKAAVRAGLGLDREAAVVLLTVGLRAGAWTDRETLERAMNAIAAHPSGRGALFVTVGGDGGRALRATGADVRTVGYQTAPSMMARYYQAADVYLHAARADTFPLTILEALACGTPVVATAVGGISEQINSGATGMLVAAGDADGMAEAVIALLANSEARRFLGERAARDACDRFDVNRQVECYLARYQTIIDDGHHH